MNIFFLTNRRGVDPSSTFEPHEPQGMIRRCVSANLRTCVHIRMGVRRNIVPWICDFLHNRKQCVRFNNTLSEDLQLTAGVPQGTKLGPIGFQILINDAAADAESEYWKYVDDLTFAENNTGTMQGHLQDDLHEFSKWSSSNGLISMQTNVKPLRLISVEPHHIMLT